jgi:hypothetical protein
MSEILNPHNPRWWDIRNQIMFEHDQCNRLTLGSGAWMVQAKKTMDLVRAYRTERDYAEEVEQAARVRSARDTWVALFDSKLTMGGSSPELELMLETACSLYKFDQMLHTGLD